MLTNREKLRRLGIFAWDPYGEEKDICDEDFEKIVEILGKKDKEKD